VRAATGLYPRHPIRPALCGGAEGLFPGRRHPGNLRLFDGNRYHGVGGANQIQIRGGFRRPGIAGARPGITDRVCGSLVPAIPGVSGGKIQPEYPQPSRLRGKTIGLPGYMEPITSACERYCMLEG